MGTLEETVQVNEVTLSRRGCQVMYKGKGLHYLCSCNKTFHAFGTHREFEVHFRDSVGRSLQYLCFNCYQSFTNIRSVAKHNIHCLRSNTAVPDGGSTRVETPTAYARPRQCPYCAFRACNKRGLRRHIHHRHQVELYNLYKIKRPIDKRWEKSETQVLVKAVYEQLLARRLPITDVAILSCLRDGYLQCKGKIQKAFRHIMLWHCKGELKSELERYQARKARRRALMERHDDMVSQDSPIVQTCDCLNYIRLSIRALVATDNTTPVADRRLCQTIRRDLNSQSASTGTKLLEALYKRFGEKTDGGKGRSSGLRESRGSRNRLDLTDHNQLYKKLKAKAFVNHLCEPGLIELEPGLEAIEWFGGQFERPSIDDTEAAWPMIGKAASTCRLHAMISDKEVEMHVKSFNKHTASGADRFTIVHLQSIPFQLLAILMNLFLLGGDVPEALKINRTTLLAKKPNPGPQDWRPITVSSVIYRLFSKIITKRLAEEIYLSPHQRAFTAGIDGCLENAATIAMLIREANAGRGQVFICSLDLAKAFDSVSFSSIKRALQRQKIDQISLNLLINILYNNKTIISQSKQANITRGVRQGDPISPLLFNLVVDEVFGLIRESRHGAKYIKRDGTEARIGAVAFADDITLLCDSQRSLEKMLAVCVKFFHRRGMRINYKKSFCLAIKRIPCSDMCTPMPVKVEVVDPESGSVECLPCLGPSEDLRILGTYVTPTGKPFLQMNRLRDLLDKTMNSSLEQHYKVEIIRDHIVFKFRYQVAYGKVNQTEAGQADSLIRQYLRQILDLPNHTAIAFFHLPISQGGLGIERLEFAATYLRVKAELRLLASVRKATSESVRVAKVRDEYLRLSIDLGRLSQRDAVSWRETVDSEQLARRLKGIDVEKWYLDSRQRQIARDTRVISSMTQGAAYPYLKNAPNGYLREPERYNLQLGKIPMVYRLRLGQLRTLSNLRGKQSGNLYKRCRLGCEGKVETPKHVLQKCIHTKKWQHERHNSIVGLLYRKLVTQLNGEHDSILREQELVLNSSTSQNEVRLKPDLIVVCRNRGSMGDGVVRVAIIDVQCAYETTNGSSLGRAYNGKRTKYEMLKGWLTNKPNLEVLRQRAGETCTLWMATVDPNVKFIVIPFIVGVRGGWVGSNSKFFSFLLLGEDKVLVNRIMRTVAERSINIFKKFMGRVRLDGQAATRDSREGQRTIGG